MFGSCYKFKPPPLFPHSSPSSPRSWEFGKRIMIPCHAIPTLFFLLLPRSWEFGKRIVIQQRCTQCGGSGLVPTSKEGGRCVGGGVEGEAGMHVRSVAEARSRP